MNEKMNDLTERCINKFHELANLFRKKNKQYGDKDQLANFRNGAMMHMVESNKQAAEKTKENDNE